MFHTPRPFTSPLFQQPNIPWWAQHILRLPLCSVLLTSLFLLPVNTKLSPTSQSTLNIAIRQLNSKHCVRRFHYNVSSKATCCKWKCSSTTSQLAQLVTCQLIYQCYTLLTSFPPHCLWNLNTLVWVHLFNETWTVIDWLLCKIAVRQKRKRNEADINSYGLVDMECCGSIYQWVYCREINCYGLVVMQYGGSIYQ